MVVTDGNDSPLSHMLGSNGTVSVISKLLCTYNIYIHNRCSPPHVTLYAMHKLQKVSDDERALESPLSFKGTPPRKANGLTAIPLDPACPPSAPAHSARRTKSTVQSTERITQSGEHSIG